MRRCTGAQHDDSACIVPQGPTKLQMHACMHRQTMCLCGTPLTSTAVPLSTELMLLKHHALRQQHSMLALPARVSCLSHRLWLEGCVLLPLALQRPCRSFQRCFGPSSAFPMPHTLQTYLQQLQALLLDSALLATGSQLYSIMERGELA